MTCESLLRLLGLWPSGFFIVKVNDLSQIFEVLTIS